MINGSTTGGSMNPMRAVAPAVALNVLETEMWIYIVGPILGGILAGVLYKFCFLNKQ